LNFSPGNKGFTLVELLVVIAILAVMALIALPRISGFMNSQRQDSALLMAYLTAVSDEAYISGETKYLCIHLNMPGGESIGHLDKNNIKQNSLSTYTLSNDIFEISSRKVLGLRSFRSSFILHQVIFEGGRIVERGNVLIPFYADGSSEGFIIRILSDGKDIFVRKKSISKTPLIEDVI